MSRKSLPEYEFICKSHDEQLHFINPQDDMIEKTEQVIIIGPILVILIMTNHVLKTNPSRKYRYIHVSGKPVAKTFSLSMCHILHEH